MKVYSGLLMKSLLGKTRERTTENLCETEESKNGYFVFKCIQKTPTDLFPKLFYQFLFDNAS